ncbi:aminofutalosine deaminase family hydrolase [Sulfurospirillum sp. 1612]|uniref:aminofutalosine deaminase family hydrolase n=1 Tax=Sulfurospirillum sp. 1612 TaxID=3094835 RepID=UPI002F92A1D9
MKILQADYILTCNDDFEIITDGAICFDDTIIEIGKSQTILNKYKDTPVIWAGKNSVLLPGLINTHVHLEFSANTTSLTYGDFIPWLNSVIKNRDAILDAGGAGCMEEQLQKMLHSGTTTLGEISSFGDDFDVCVKTPQKVVYFTELLGSRPDSVDVLFQDFQSKLHHSEDSRSDTFIPAISIHSPYSTHPILAKNALDIARKENYPVSTHFMESTAERDWLDSGTGDFMNFFNAFAPNARPFVNALEYLDLFQDTHTLFTHCTKAHHDEIEKIQKMGGCITHCPVSNRLLNSGRLEIENIDKKMLTLGTDGLSSNLSLSLWDEMRAALMLHYQGDLRLLSRLLLKMSTTQAASALGLNNGALKEKKDADIIALHLPSKLQSLEDLCTQIILHTKVVDKAFINGKEIL